MRRARVHAASSRRRTRGRGRRAGLAALVRPGRPAALAAALVTGALLAGVGWAQTPSWPDPSQLTYPPLDVRSSSPRREVLSNGIVVYLAEDHTLPLVQGIAYVDAPSVYDPADEVGLSGFTADMLREGGAGGRSPDEIDGELEYLGASVEASSSDVLASVSFSSLADNVGDVLPIWRDVLSAPDFDPQRIDIERQRQLEALRRVADNPVQVAVREFSYRVAEGHPSGAYPTEATINAITRDDLIAFHADYYGPASTVVAVTGDFDADAMLATLEDTLGGWHHDLATPPALPAFDPHPAPKVYFAQKDVQQSVILVGQPAMRAYTPSYDAFTVANHILGAGGFSSRMFTDIRTKRGLAYATGSQLTQGFDYPGIFLAYAFTRADATGQVLQLILDEIRGLVDDGVTQAELDQSRTTIVNQAVFRDTSVAAITQRQARVDLLGLEPGYFERFLDTVQGLTPADVQASAREVLRPDDLVIMVVGNADAFDRPLSDFGEVVDVALP